MEVLGRLVRQAKERKCVQIRKEEVKLSLCTDDVISYINNPKEYTKKRLELIHRFGKIAGYKISI